MKRIQNCQVWNGEVFLKHHDVVFNKGKIIRIEKFNKNNSWNDSSANEKESNNKVTIIDGKNGYLIPGFIDIQCNGGGGYQFNSCENLQEYQKIIDTHLQFGTTSILPTFITDSDINLNKFLELSQNYSKEKELLGIHLEGPFIFEDKKGIHNEEYIQKINPKKFKEIKKYKIPGTKLVTLDPQNISETDFQKIKSDDVLFFAGHSNATFETMKKFSPNYIQGVTHLFNACSQISAREAGIVGSCFLLEDLYCSIIADGNHVCKESLEILFRQKSFNKIILVSDAMLPFGTNKKSFTLYNEKIFVKEKKLVNQKGVLAGSNICLLDAFSFLIKQNLLPVEKIIPMTSTNAAKLLGLENKKGRIANEYDADFILFNSKTWDIEMIFSAGELR